MREIEIKECNYCPFFRYDEMTYSGFCSRNEYDIDEKLLIEKFDFDQIITIPEWCPLRTNEVLIRLSEGVNFR